MSIKNLLPQIILYFSLTKIFICYIETPFYTHHSSHPNKTNDNDYVKYFSENQIYIYLNIGDPTQKIVSTLNFNEYPLLICYNICEIESAFSINNSLTYTEKSNGNFFINPIGRSVSTYIVNDSFYFNDNNNPYILSYLFVPLNRGKYEEEFKKTPYTCADIGLKLPSSELRSYHYNFVRMLRASDSIKDYVYFLEYDDKNDETGKFVIGIEPHEYNPKKYKSDDLKQIYSIQAYTGIYWQLKFNSVYFKKFENETEMNVNLENTDVGLEPNLNVILATYEYMEMIEKEFFNKKKNLCEKNRLYNNYINYECINYTDVQEFPSLYFVHRNLGASFELNYKDLWIEYNGKYISLIWISLNDRKNWRFGKPFLKKYFFSYNVDKKLMSFYPTNEEGDKSENDKDSTINDEKKYNLSWFKSDK